MYSLKQKKNKTWVLIIGSPVYNVFKQYEFKRYIEAIETVQLLQLNLNENDKNNKPHTYESEQ